jgi:hypothetical protein
MIEEKRSVVVGQIYGGIGSGEKPQWVECIKEGVILQPQGRRIDLAGLNNSPALLQAIRQTGYVVFLVRPQGFEAFQHARALAIARGPGSAMSRWMRSGCCDLEKAHDDEAGGRA